MDAVTFISLILGVLGLVVSIWGSYISYISFINPMIRFRKYLKNSSGWEKFQGIEDHLSFYRYKKYPNFQIIIDWDKELAEGFHEEWIDDSLYPDKTNNVSYYVRLEANAMLLEKELFVSLDGHRYFVPVPKISQVKNDKRKFYYDHQQIQVAKIVGRHHFGENISEFAKRQNIFIDK